MNLISTIVRPCKSISLNCMRFKSNLPQNVVVFASDRMVVCWHPEKPFPYECSLPIPKEENLDNSVLKMDKEYSYALNHPRREVVIQNLAKMTFTTKHRWYPRARDDKVRPIPPDRPYL